MSKPPDTGRGVHRLQRWTAGAIALCLAMLLALGWLQFEQRQAMQAALQALSALRTAQVDLARGLARLQVAVDTDAAPARAEGLALLEQAATAFERIAADADLPAAEAAALGRDVQTLRARLAPWQTAPPPGAAQALALQRALSALEQRAHVLEDTAQAGLHTLADTNDRRFAAALAAALIGLAVLGAAELRVGRHEVAAMAEQGRLAQALAESEAGLRRLFQSAPVAMALSKLDGTILDQNARFTQVFGYTLQDVPDVPTWNRLAYPDPDYRARMMARSNAALQEAIATGALVDVGERSVRCKDGSERIIRIEGVLLAEGLLSAFIDLTDLRRAEQALAESEAALRRIFQQAPIAMALWKQDGRILASNARFTQLFGYTPEDLPDIPTWNRLAFPDPAVRAQALAQRNSAVQRAIATGTLSDVEERRIRCKDGSDRIIWVSAISLADGILSAFIDVTDLRRAEQDLAAALAEQKAARLAALNQMEDANAARREAEAASAALAASEARYRSVFEAANVGKSMTSADGRVEVNRAFAEMLGYTPEEIKGKTWQALTPEEDLAPTNRLLAMLQRGERDEVRFEKRYLHKNGSLVWADLHVAALRDAGGQVRQFIVTAVDITERKRSTQALRDSEERLQLLIEHAPAALAMFDREMRYLAASRRWCDDYALDVQAIIGRSQYEVMPETPERWKAVHQRALAGEVVSADEDRIERPNGTVQWTRWAVRPWRAHDGAVGGIVIFSEEISRLVAARHQILELNAGLERRVAERTAELSAANRELESFAYAVSHDLRAPLRAMSGFSRALQEDFGATLTGEAKTYLDQIGLAAHKMSELIDGILALSRSTRGELRHDRVDVSALARRHLADLAAAEPERRVAVEVEDGLVVIGDERMLATALANLLDNAWKYTGRAAAPRIRVHAGSVAGQHGICISDNGAGFNMAYGARLFQPFQRLHRQDEFPGIGIGLATVQRIVHRHGGEVVAQAAPGEGATFCIRLPEAARASNEEPTA